MARYNTDNPIGSNAMKDLSDNAQNLDVLVNSKTALTQTDRLGVERKTWHGMERDYDAAQASRENQFQSAQSSREAAFSDFLQESGYQDLGEYAPGIEITAHNQYVTFGGQPYLLKPSIPVPYTTSGVWTGDDFKLIGDDALRQDLANPDKGAAMIGGGGQVVGSISALRALVKSNPSKSAFVTGYEAQGDGGGGLYYLDASDVTTADNGGTVIVATDGGRWKLQHNGSVRVEQFGCLSVPGRNNFTNLQNAVATCHAESLKLVAGKGTFEYGTTLDLSYPTLVFHGSGFRNTIFKFTGTGRAMRADGDRPNNGIYSFDLDLCDFTIEGNPNATDLLRNRINHARIVRVNAREASTTNGCGFRFEGTVAGHYEQLTMSTNTQLMSSRPANGIVIDADPSLPGSPRATCNTLLSPCIEGATGDGIVLTGCDQLTVIGGTSENNGGNGLTELPGTQMCTYIGFGCEVNLGYADIFIAGQSSHLINCGSTRLTYIDNSAVMTKIEGGWFDKVEVAAGAVATELSKIKTRFFGGAVGLVTNSNPFLSTKDIFDVQANAFVFFPKPASVIANTASPMTYMNTNITDETILINPNGGSITQITYLRGGGAVANMNPASGSVRLQPGDGVSLDYTGSPILTRVPNGTNMQ